MSFAAPRDQDVDGAFDAVFRQQFRRSKAGFFLKVVGNDDLAGMERIAGGELQIDAQGYLADRLRPPIRRLRLPATFFPPACTPRPLRRCFETLGAEFRRSLQYLADVAGLQRGSAEFAQQGLLPQPVRKFLSRCGGRRDGRRHGLGPRGGWHEFVPSKCRGWPALGL